MIDRIRLTASAKNQLSTLKRKTGIEHYNSICRYALCLSLAEASMPPDEDLSYSGGIEIDWRTLTGGHEDLYLNLLLLRVQQDGEPTTPENIKKLCTHHLHRGLSYLISNNQNHLIESAIFS
ncbi:MULTISPECIES: DNA sulfur modification protein DndE [Pseudomonas]|uniref:DNA sulfur modification protein DndE n=1 Tax=Pseudomonas TaxID=286 RepID=UPI000EB0C6DF|nr:MULTISPECIES: DNA sulfur modification protein DndE [Pseudomonas]MDV6731714.1 DNA sulfur modification protein DndE [Pseudomonas aeruginosa]MDV6820225.1 DNA sulfur modification protein DndE [Pseudomonas aeruginosa]RUC61434.1 DNA sulfur modification protein DndE [Pseudomonas aeruginosa]HBP5283224.1 DNA sulfur modification protein DndE [Pseudomonas aeruginosa]